MPDDYTMRVKLTGPSRRKLDSLAEYHGMSPTELLTCLVEWFGEANESTRREIEAHFARSMIRRTGDVN